MNRVVLNAVLVERAALRATPAGVAVLEMQLQHRSETVEAGVPRTLDFSVDAMAIGEAARTLAAESLGAALRVTGFLAPRSQRSKRVVVHITQVERVPGESASGIR